MPMSPRSILLFSLDDSVNNMCSSSTLQDTWILDYLIKMRGYPTFLSFFLSFFFFFFFFFFFISIAVDNAGRNNSLLGGTVFSIKLLFVFDFPIVWSII